MSNLAKLSRSNKPDAELDLRKRLFNDGKVGRVTEVQVSADRITRLSGILYDLDPALFIKGGIIPAFDSSAGDFYDRVAKLWLDNHSVLSKCEVRATGTGLHAILWFAEPVEINSDAERAKWAAKAKVIQAALPIDPDQPGGRRCCGRQRQLGGVECERYRRWWLTWISGTAAGCPNNQSHLSGPHRAEWRRKFGEDMECLGSNAATAVIINARFVLAASGGRCTSVAVRRQSRPAARTNNGRLSGQSTSSSTTASAPSPWPSKIIYPGSVCWSERACFAAATISTPVATGDFEMTQEASQQPFQLPTRQEFDHLCQQANAGDPSALAALRQLLDQEPQLAEHFGDLFEFAKEALIGLMGRNNALLAESLRRRAKAMERELAGEKPTLLERLVVRRVVLSWIRLQHVDTTAPDPSSRKALARKSAAERSWVQALKSLELVRSKLMPRRPTPEPPRKAIRRPPVSPPTSLPVNRIRQLVGCN